MTQRIDFGADGEGTDISVGDTVYYGAVVAQVVGIRDRGKPYLIRYGPRSQTAYVDRDEITKP